MEITAIRDELDKVKGSLETLLKAVDLFEPLPIERDATLRMGSPTDDQLAQMNRYRPAGSDEYKRDEVVTIPLRASHNLIQLSGLIAWHPRAIAAMGQKLVDRPHLVDHDWDSVSGSIGFFYDSQVIVENALPLMDGAMNGKEDVNRMIVEKYGYHRLILHACIEKGSPAESAYRFRRLGDVSTGNLVIPSYICPIDDRDFSDPECPYLPPTEWILAMAEAGELSPEEMQLIAPYMMRDGVFYGVETSAVVIGNLPGAGVVRNG